VQTTGSVSQTGGSKVLRVLNRMKVKIAVLIIFHVAIIGAVGSIGFALDNLNYPYQLDESEGMIAAEVKLLDEGVAIFDRPGPQQFIAAPYPPLYYLLNWPLLKLTGADYSLKGGRLITIFFSLLAAVALWLIVHNLTRNRLAAFAVANLWLANALVAFWGGIVKPDVPALALGLLGLWLVLRVIGRPAGAEVGGGSLVAAGASVSHASWLLPVLFFFAASFTKQTSLAAAAAGLLGLLLWRWRRGAMAVGLYVGLVVGSFLLLNWLTAGGYYWHIFTVHNLPWNAAHAAEVLSTVAAVNWPLPLLAVAGFAVYLLVGDKAYPHTTKKRVDALSIEESRQPSLAISPLRNPKLLVVLAYFVVSALQASGIGTLGGNHNHLLDLLAACCIGFGLLVAYFAAQWERGGRRGTLVGVGGLLLVGALTWVLVRADYDPYAKFASQLRPLSAAQREGMRNIGQYVTNAPGEAYSTDVSVLLAAGKYIPSTDPYTQTHASHYARWDESVLVTDLNRRRYSQVILPGNVADPCTEGGGQVSDGIRLAVCQHYRLEQKNVLNIFVPKLGCIMAKPRSA